MLHTAHYVDITPVVSDLIRRPLSRMCGKLPVPCSIFTITISFTRTSSQRTCCLETTLRSCSAILVSPCLRIRWGLLVGRRELAPSPTWPPSRSAGSPAWRAISTPWVWWCTSGCVGYHPFRAHHPESCTSTCLLPHRLSPAGFLLFRLPWGTWCLE